METAIKAALIFGLKRVINRIAAVVLDRDGTERVKAVVGRVGIWNAIKILVGIVIPGEVFSAVADIGEAGGAVGIQLPLNLQIPLTDVRRDVGRKNGDDADTRRICEVESREIPAGKRRRGLRGIELACRAIWLASQGACECDAKALAVVDAVLTAERRVLRKLIADAAAIEEVENSVAASDYRLAIAGKLIGEADARAKIVVVVRNEAARDGILVGEFERAG